MTLRYSTALASFLANHGSFRDAFAEGEIRIYSGAQPANADAAPTGTLLCTITANAGARTPGVLSAGSITLTGGAAGSVDTLTVNGQNIIENPVPFNTSLNQTALDLAAEVNRSLKSPGYMAKATGATVTLTAKPGSGTTPNGYAVAATLTTITATYGAFAGGVAPINGLKFGPAAAGLISKKASQVWSGVNASTGTAGWYRFTGLRVDSGALDGTESQIREDGAIATSGAQLNLSSTALVAGATTTIDTWDRTVPTT